MTKVARAPSRPRDALFLAVLALALYGLTLAPTVLWFDGAYLQLIAAQRALQASAGSHPLWVWIANLFTFLPVGDIAGRVNFVSAFFGATTIGLLYLVLSEMGIQRFPAVLATLAFMVSHTFWSNAVAAEVYTLTLTLMTLQIWSVLRWHRTGRLAYLILTGAVIGLGIAAHLLVLLFVPAFLWLAWYDRRQLSGRAVLYFAIGLLACLAPFIAVLVRDALHMGLNVPETLRWAVFNSDGNNFRGAFFDFSLRLLPSDLFQWGAYLALQFVGLAGLCGLVGAVTIWRMAERPLAIYMVLLYLGVMIFAFAYRVGDRYVFYLPGYLPFTVWIGFGAQWLWDRAARSHALWMRTGWAQALLVILVLSVPVALYRIAPELVSRGVTFREARHVPGPNSRYYFLWPPKTGYTDTRLYAEETMASLPADAVLYADHVLIAPLIFLQRVEGIRPDVTLKVCCGEDLVAAVEGGGNRPLAIADVTPGIYPIQWLLASHDVIPLGPVYLVVGKAR